tara:strand:- start:202 stop:357 length:156 start_codon:yes stop_codon:yes gene_type:complete
MDIDDRLWYKMYKKIFRLPGNSNPVELVDNTRKISYSQNGNEPVKIDEESE